MRARANHGVAPDESVIFVLFEPGISGESSPYLVLNIWRASLTQQMLTLVRYFQVVLLRRWSLECAPRQFEISRSTHFKYLIFIIQTYEISNCNIFCVDSRGVDLDHIVSVELMYLETVEITIFGDMYE